MIEYFKLLVLSTLSLSSLEATQFRVDELKEFGFSSFIIKLLDDSIKDVVARENSQILADAYISLRNREFKEAKGWLENLDRDLKLYPIVYLIRSFLNFTPKEPIDMQEIAKIDSSLYSLSRAFEVSTSIYAKEIDREREYLSKELYLLGVISTLSTIFNVNSNIDRDIAKLLDLKSNSNFIDFLKENAKNSIERELYIFENRLYIKKKPKNYSQIIDEFNLRNLSGFKRIELYNIFAKSFLDSNLEIQIKIVDRLIKNLNSLIYIDISKVAYSLVIFNSLYIGYSKYTHSKRDIATYIYNEFELKTQKLMGYNLREDIIEMFRN